MFIDADTIVGFWPIRRTDISVPTLKEAMARHRIDRACACSARGVWYDYAEGNEETLRVASEDGQLIPVLTVDPRRFVGCREEIKRRTEEGHHLFRLFPEYQGWSPNTPSGRKLLGWLEDAGAVVMLGGAAVEAIQAVRGMHTPVILTWCHFYQLAEVLAMSDELPNVFLTTRFLVGPGSLALAARHLGASHLIFGSHAPVEYLAPALRLLDAADVGPAERSAILGGNLERLLEGQDDHH